jgi:tRNA uridine 5-carboxymethylaminomethyl modification enzyme
LASVESAPIHQKSKLYNLLLRPQVNMASLAAAMPIAGDFLGKFDAEVIELAEINMKYEGYISKEQDLVDKMSRLEDLKLQPDFDYHTLNALSKEARTKLTQHRPRTIGQAGRISGISPADVSVLLVHLGR